MLEGFDPTFDFIAYGFRPHVGFELAVTETMNIFAEVQVRTFPIDGFDPIIEPGLSTGLAW